MLHNNEYLNKLYYEIIYDFTDKSSLTELKIQNETQNLNERPRFSFMMTIYNNMELLNTAINSIYKQNFEDWELIIWDNSDKNTKVWETIENAMEVDKRIRGYRNGESLGWRKGAAMCMQHVRGEYTTFLAADDCLNLGALEYLDGVIEEHHPDVVWVNFGVVITEDEKCALSYKGEIEEKVFENDLRSETIFEIMQTIYYNSFFHFMRVDFLREENIDFFEPYYGDVGGMTQAMAKAKKMVTISPIIYFLTENTSQSRGFYLWGSHQYMFGQQWRSVKSVFQKENYKNTVVFAYVSARILKNMLGSLGALCEGRCRDKFMNSMSVTREQIIGQVEECLTSEDIQEMLFHSDIKEFSMFEMLLQQLAILKYNESDENIISGVHCLMKYAHIVQNNKTEDTLPYLLTWILDEDNKKCIGFNHLLKKLDECSDDIIITYREVLEKIMEKYSKVLENE